MYMEMYREVGMKFVDEGPIPVAEARQRLPQLLRSVEQGEDVQISRRGKPVAVLISVEEYDRLRRRRSRRGRRRRRPWARPGGPRLRRRTTRCR